MCTCDYSSDPCRGLRRGSQTSLTCQTFLADFESVYQRSEDALDGAEHAAQAEVNQHEEEHDGPEGRGWEVSHGLREGNEGQACALDRLLGGEKKKELYFTPIAVAFCLITQYNENPPLSSVSH